MIALILALFAWFAFIPVVLYDYYLAKRTVGAYEQSFIGAFAYTNTIEDFDALSGIQKHPDINSPCLLKITGPRSNADAVWSLRKLAFVADCYVLPEPFNPEIDDQAWREITSSTPGSIIIHAAQSNTRAEGFVSGMSNTFRVGRAYDLPPGSPANLVRLQIGSGSV